MKALVSLLPDRYCEEILSLWEEMEARFGFSDIYVAPQPHITWQYGDDYQGDYLGILDELFLNPSEIEVRTDLVTWFSAESPIVYLRVVETPELLELHRVLWDRLIPLCQNPSLLYAPGTWKPHITLSMECHSWLKLPELYRFLKTKQLSWNFRLDNLTVLFQNEEKAISVEKKILL